VSAPPGSKRLNTPNKGFYYRLRPRIVKVKKFLGKPFNLLWFWFYKLFRSRKVFVFQGKRYSYFHRFYNATWINERAVEIPIVWEMVAECRQRGRRILEVGNVLSHYFLVDHDVVDKYEKASRVINEDIVSFHPDRRYDLIVCVSTLEHVGWDEAPRDPTKIPAVLRNLEGLLAPGGRLVATFPVGYNSDLDELINSGKVRFTSQKYLKRISSANEWREAEWDEVRDSRFTYSFFTVTANGIVVGMVAKQTG
jgi:SAM-dependent methyltransferase